MLLSGTRDLFLSLTVLTHRKLRRAGVPASLHLIEGASHYQYFINPFADESQDAFAEMTIFINENLSE
jgi:acetyl esterase/lipase